MYQDYFADEEDDWDEQTYFRFTAYLKTAIVRTRAKYLERTKHVNGEKEAVQKLMPIEDHDYKEQCRLEDVLVREALQNELKKLKPNERAAILYRFLYEMKDKEIALRLHLSRSGAQHLRTRTAKKMKKQIEKWLLD